MAGTGAAAERTEAVSRSAGRRAPSTYLLPTPLDSGGMAWLARRNEHDLRSNKCPAAPVVSSHRRFPSSASLSLSRLRASGAAASGADRSVPLRRIAGQIETPRPGPVLASFRFLIVYAHDDTSARARSASRATRLHHARAPPNRQRLPDRSMGRVSSSSLSTAPRDHTDGQTARHRTWACMAAIAARAIRHHPRRAVDRGRSGSTGDGQGPCPDTSRARCYVW